MELTNHAKRMEFVQNPANWEPLPSADNFVRITKLMYKGHMWLKVELWQTADHWNYDLKKMVESTGWDSPRFYKINEHTHALNWGVSPTEIANEIKDINKKEKEGK